MRFIKSRLRARAARRRTFFGVEPLEGRLAPATFAPLASAVDGAAGSLRAAIIASNGNGQDDTITLQAGVYQLTLANAGGQENAAATGDLDLTEAGRTITIQSAGAGVSIVDAGGLDRVFQVQGNVTAVFRDLTIRNGNARDQGLPGIPLVPGDSLGGGILNAGSVTLDGVIVENSSARGLPGQDGPDGMSGTSGTAGLGGGIASSGALSVSRSILRNNVAIGGRGGAAGTTLFPTTAGNGGDARGGGIWLQGNSNLTLSQSTVDDNRALGGAGGEGAARPVSSGLTGGVGGEARGGGLFLGSGSNVATNSTISDNTAIGGNGGKGGAGGNSSLNIPPLNPGETGGRGGSGGNGFGGGIANETVLSLISVTIAANEAHGGSGGFGGQGGPGIPPGMEGQSGLRGVALGGGIHTLIDPGVITAVNTLIGDGVTDAASPDVEGSFASASNTILEDGDGARNIADGVNGNIVGKDAKLGPLQNNGGPTPTRLPQAGSPAIDAGSNPQGLTTDQRGFTPRVVDKAADIGAVETGATAPTSGGGGGARPARIAVGPG